MSESAAPKPTGHVIAPVASTTETEGLELKVRSQWSYARDRFLRHRLALGGLILLIIIFGAGIFADWVAPYPLGRIDLHGILHPLSPPTTQGHHYFGTNEIGTDE